MTSKHLTPLLPIADVAWMAARQRNLVDQAHVLAFGAIGWPWLLKSLWGGRKADRAALLDRLGLAQDVLPHLGSWKADVGFLKVIADEIEARRPATVVELGAGASTLVAARAMTLAGGGALLSFDQHAGFVEATAAWLADNALAAEVRHAPLGPAPAGWPGRWYQTGPLPERIDLLIIDGPPWAEHPYVRGAAETLFERLPVGGVVLLDDAARPGERIVARRWRRGWPGFRFTLLPGGTKGTLMGVREA